MACLGNFALFLVLFVILNAQCRAVTIEKKDDSTFKNSPTDTGSTTNTSGGGHEPAAIQTLPIVTWKWHHVETPYLVALWILTCWLCKLGKQHQVTIITISIAIILTQRK